MSYGVAQERDWNALDDEDFRRIVRQDLEANYPEELRYPPRRLRWSALSDWYRRQARRGWIAPTWPVEYGGMGLSARKALILLEENERHGVARFQDHGILMVGPILMRYGTEAQRRRFLPGILSCDAIWCQGYSEPGAGSDLASLRTRAVPAGADYVIDGQKIWTTLAQDATHIFLLARTDPDAKKQAGISFFLVEIDSPGITVRPIRDLAGNEEFCEVFLDGVRVPADNLVGGVNRGWEVAKSLLAFERVALGSPKFCEYGLHLLCEIAAAAGVADDPVFRDRLAGLKLDVAHLADVYAHHARRLAADEPLGPEVSLLKIWSTETFQRIADLALETAGAAGGLRGAVEIGGRSIEVLAAYYKARPATIYGGSNEIQRNILARHQLALPTA